MIRDGYALHSYILHVSPDDGFCSGCSSARPIVHIRRIGETTRQDDRLFDICETCLLQIIQVCFRDGSGV